MNKKEGIILLVAIAVFAIYIGIAIFLSKKDENYLIVYPGVLYQYKNGKLIEKDLNKIKERKYVVSKEGVLYPGSNVTYNETLKFNDEVAPSVFIATSGNIGNVEFSLQKVEPSDIIAINSVLKGQGIKDYDELSYAQKIEIDFDKDGIVETFYSISNAFSDDLEKKQDFSAIFVSKDGDIETLFLNKAEVDDYSKTCVSSIYGIIDLKKDSKYELVTGCTYFDQIGTKYSIYKYKDGAFEETKLGGLS